MVEVRDGTGPESTLLGEDLIRSSFVSVPSFCKLATSSLCLQLSSPECEAPPETYTQQPTRWRCGSSQTPRAAVEDSGPTSLRASTWAHLVLDLGASQLSDLCAVSFNYSSCSLPPAPCADGEFRCPAGGCIHGDRRCDGAVDCSDSSDEADCGGLGIPRTASMPTTDTFTRTPFSLLTGKWFQPSPVPGRGQPPHRLRRHLDLRTLCLHLPVPWIQVPRPSALTCRCFSVSAQSE